MEIKTVSIIGLGALGIMYAHHFSKKFSKENVRIIADQDRINRYLKTGIYCNGELCDFNYVTPEESIPPSDLILFTVKFEGLQNAIRSVINHVGPNTIFMSALNGIISEEMIGEAFGFDNVLYCVAQGMDAVKVDNQLTYHHKGKLVFGDRKSGIISEQTRAVEKFFQLVELPYEIDTNMKHRIWGKFMLNVGVNQTVAVYKSNYGEVLKEGEARQTMIAAMREVIKVAEKEGIGLSEDDLSYWLTVLGTLSPEGKPSMAQDVDAKRLSEVELFSGTVLKYAQKHNINVPVNKLLYEKISSIESEYVR
ncbi:ketopantoate reductase family protein [Ureibacillus manganicus]|uniref:2-dehydropantoate 2-reductase n=1 Tax=Ureibacillus manganicus DSM 26584 TaxID=1384049 RepID=A0A0A3I8Z8_9BACL|nr:ketopantoate reductase family protein [Ureibacillus manganicus]KGR79243.1 2-dehydropantoate 2-reductase [Ureibacillus manganicus DSM 26584]